MAFWDSGKAMWKKVGVHRLTTARKRTKFRGMDTPDKNMNEMNEAIVPRLLFVLTACL